MRKIVLASILFVTMLMAGTGQALTTDLIAGRTKVPVGEVSIWDDSGYLYVKFLITDSDVVITETHVHVAIDDGDGYPDSGDTYPIPLTKSGSPKIGNFDFSSVHDPAVTEYTYEIPLDEWDGITELFVAAHAVVGIGTSINPAYLSLPAQVNMEAAMAPPAHPDNNYSNASSYLPELIVSGISIPTSIDGTYAGWCMDTDYEINYGVYACLVFSSYNISSFTDRPADMMENYWNLPCVNWLLNNISIGDESTLYPGQYFTYGDIQAAIWILIGDDPDDGSYLGPWSYDRAVEIADAALTNGADFVPGCGDVVGIILVPYIIEETDTQSPCCYYNTVEREYLQPVIITIPMPCRYCYETAWGSGCEFPGRDWSMYIIYPEGSCIPSCSFGCWYYPSWNCNHCNMNKFQNKKIKKFNNNSCQTSCGNSYGNNGWNNGWNNWLMN